MNCFNYVKIHDNAASCTGNTDNCWILPDGQVMVEGVRVDPEKLGWTRDRDCAGYNAASTPCSSCDGSTTPTPNPDPGTPTDQGGGQRLVQYATSILRKTLSGIFELTTNFGDSSDILLYRLYKQTGVGSLAVLEATPLWTAQGRGGQRVFTIDYAFAANEYYALRVQRAGTTQLPVAQNDLQLAVAVDPSDIAVDADPDDFENSAPVLTGDGFSYTYANPDTADEQDFRGISIRKTSAPAVVSQQKSQPRLLAGRFFFTPQTAMNAMVASRFAPFSIPFSWDGTTLSGWLVPYSGPDYSAQRPTIMARGFNAIAESTPNRPAYGNTKGYYNISGGYDEAKTAAERTGVDPALAAILMRWYNNGQGAHESIVNAAAAELLGIEIYTQKQNADWTTANGGPMLAVTLNFEVSIPPAGSGMSEEDARMNMIGLVMRGVRKAALAKGHVPPLLVCYDHSGLAFINPQLISRDLPASSGTYGDFNNIPYSNAIAGLPAYFEGPFLSIAVKGGSGNNPMTANNEMVKYVKEFGGIMGSQEYMQSTYPDESLWQKNANGTFKTRSVVDAFGVTWPMLVAVDVARDVQIQGEMASLLPKAFYSDGEAQNFLQDWYRLAHMGVVDYTTRAGRQHYALSNVRQAGWEKMFLGHWTRGDAEFKNLDRIKDPSTGTTFLTNPVSGNPYNLELDALNSRPLNLDFAEFDLIHNLVCCLRDLYRIWNGPQPIITELGKSLKNTPFAGYGDKARAIYETYIKALERANQFAWVKQNVMQPMFGELPVRNFARDRTWHNYNDEFERKAIVNALMCSQRADRNNTPWMVLAGTFPAMDPGVTTLLQVECLNDNGTVDGPAYQIQMGRTIGIDDFQITTSQSLKPPKNWRYTYPDLFGKPRRRLFDYREANPVQPV